MPALFHTAALVGVLQLGGPIDPGPGGSNPFAINLPEAFADTKAKLAAGGTANILFFGDSLTLREGSYWPYLQTLFQREYGNAGSGYQPFSQWTGVSFDSGWTFGPINSDISPRRALDGLWASSTSSPWPPTSTGARMFAYADIVDIHYVLQPNGGTFTISPPSAPPLVFVNTAASSQGVGIWTHHFTPAENRLMWFQPQGNGQIVILGQNARIEAPGVRMHRAANGGWGVANFLMRDFSFDGQIGALEPDLIFIWLGQNDWAFTYDGYVASLGNLVSRIQAAAPGAEIVVIGTYNSNAWHLPTVVSADREVAIQRNIGYLDLYSTAGLTGFFVVNGYLDDVVHFSHLGGRYIAHHLWRAWKTDGASLTSDLPIPACSGDANLDNKTDGGDLTVLLGSFGGNMPRFYGADFNGDYTVNSGDLSILLSNFGCDQSID